MYAGDEVWSSVEIQDSMHTQELKTNTWNARQSLVLQGTSSFSVVVVNQICSETKGTERPRLQRHVAWKAHPSLRPRRGPRRELRNMAS
jgi:hypothetical protein